MLSDAKEQLLRMDRPVPRYTSYPTAPHFKAGFTTEEYRHWLGGIDGGQKISLYIHIPFCPSLCWFCGCHTKITQRYAPVKDYIDLLIKEIAMVGALLPKGVEVGHIHFGGGSPTITKSNDFLRLMGALQANFRVSPQAEQAIEVDPRQLNEGKIATYAKAGINRASIGVQDFDERVMEAVNRPQPFFSSYEAIHTLRDYGIRNINTDIMYGLPHQTIETMHQMIVRILLLDPDRVSLFGYAHVPWMKKHMRLISTNSLPDMSTRFDLFTYASAMLVENGYIPIGIDHFAKKGDPLALAAQEGRLHRNFQGYTDDPCPIMIGFGSSAISHLPQGFVQNTPHTSGYRDRILADDLPVEKSCSLHQEDKLRATVIEKLMCDFHADIEGLCKDYGYETDQLDESLHRLTPLVEAGLVEVAPGREVTVLARQAARLASAAFDAYLNPPGSSSLPRHVTAI